MKELTNMQLKQIVVSALRNEYGFAPKGKDVVLLEADVFRLYILLTILWALYAMMRVNFSACL